MCFCVELQLAHNFVRGCAYNMADGKLPVAFCYSLKSMRRAPCEVVGHSHIGVHKRMRVYGVRRSPHVENELLKLQDHGAEHAKLWRTFLREFGTELDDEILAREHERMTLNDDDINDRYFLSVSAVTAVDGSVPQMSALTVEWGFKEPCEVVTLEAK